MSKSESDQEDNDDLNDNDWSYGAEKRGEHRKVNIWTLIHNKHMLSTFLFFQQRKENPTRY